jgi:peptidoglycan-N-acetylglucosamine deacetylase
MYFVKTPAYLKTIYPSLLWDIKKEDTLYLTFDDGPIPEITEHILDMLQAYNAKATFFCIGENVKNNEHIFNRIKHDGHTVGNHTFHHLSGWKTDTEVYLDDISACDALVQSKLFRPPYGRIGYSQIQQLKKDYKIIMWDVLSGDFDSHITAEQCTKNVIDHATHGSIIVFHDSIKARDRVLKSLPVVLEHFSQKGFVFEPIEH